MKKLHVSLLSLLAAAILVLGVFTLTGCGAATKDSGGSSSAAGNSGTIANSGSAVGNSAAAAGSTAGDSVPHSSAAESSPQAAPSYEEISMEEAVTRMETAEDYLILDVRTLAEYESGHIPGAICVPNETIGNEEIPELPDKDQLIFIYCRSGNRSKQAAKKLVKLGYTNLVEFGGIIDWTGETVGC